MQDRALYLRLRRLVAWACRLLYRVEVVGADAIPREGGCILAANHESSIDPALVAQATERPIRFLARAELWQPGLRRVLDALGGIPVRRGRGDLGAIERAAGCVERGEVVAIFPQGTTLRFRNRRYRRGAARLALATGAPLIPVRLDGTARAFSLVPPRVGFPKLRVIVGAPLLVEQAEATRDAVARLTAELERAVGQLGRA
jgi:1-acyl-sn-glycerol-3-phosphate acyltransferase